MKSRHSCAWELIKTLDWQRSWRLHSTLGPDQSGRRRWHHCHLVKTMATTGNGLAYGRPILCALRRTLTTNMSKRFRVLTLPCENNHLPARRPSASTEQSSMRGFLIGKVTKHFTQAEVDQEGCIKKGKCLHYHHQCWGQISELKLKDRDLK